MSNEEKKDIEDKINDAMAKIVSDTVGDVQPEKKIRSIRFSRNSRELKICRTFEVSQTI